MLEHEAIEAVIVAVPLWAHADVVTQCFDAGKHVLCEKMMAWDVAGCERMMTRRRARPARCSKIGYQRHYNPLYRAAYDGVITTPAARRRVSRASRLAPQRQLAPRRRAAVARLRSVEVGISDIRPSVELAAVSAVFARIVCRARQPSAQRRELVPRRRAEGRAGIRRRVPLQGRT